VLLNGDFVAIVTPPGSINFAQVICVVDELPCYAASYLWSKKTKCAVQEQIRKEYKKLRKALVERKLVLDK